MSVAVVGTDTGVGKTVTCAVLMARYGRRFPLAYWKPVATGAVAESDTAFVQQAAAATVLPERYRFDLAVSPHLAARRARGNALACAVARESLALLDEDRSLERVGRLERLFAQRLSHLGDAPGVRAVRGIGGVAVVELASAGPGGYLDTMAPQLAAAFLERDILLRPLGNVLYFMPPYAITDAEAHRVFDAIEEVLRRRHAHC